MLLSFWIICPVGREDYIGKMVDRILTYNLVLCSIGQMSIQLQNVPRTERERERGRGEQERKKVCYNIVSMREIKEPVHWQGRAILAHCV